MTETPPNPPHSGKADTTRTDDSVVIAGPEVDIPNCTLGQIAERYDILLCDVWGVLHNGVAPYDSAHEALSAFKAKGGAVVLITNAPRPSGDVVDYLDAMAVPRASYDAIVSSGDVMSHLLDARAGEKVYHLGPSRDRGLFNRKALQPAPAEECDFILCTGLFDDDTETPDDYRAVFETYIARDLPLLCANPDLVVERGDQLLYCAGALADLYRDMGGETIYAGKPHKPIYDVSKAKGEAVLGRTVAPARVLAIGDSVRTDLTGAVAQGFDVLFVAGGIHGAERDQLGRFFAEANAHPVGIVNQLAW